MISNYINKYKNSLTKLFILFLFIIISTGCIKYDTTMEINNDKSMDITVIYALDNKLTDSSDKKVFNEFKNGFYDTKFSIKEYKDDKYSGVTATKHIDNIDDYSSTKGVFTYNMSDMFDKEKKDNYIFSVELGFIKDTYTLKMSFNSQEELLGDLESKVDADEIDDEIDDNDKDIEDEVNDDKETDDTKNELLDSYLDNMEMKFRIKLGTKANKNNATKVEDTTYIWDLTKTQNIEIEFDIYNKNFIYLVSGVLALISIILIIKSKIDKSSNVTPEERKLHNANLPMDNQFLFVNKKLGYEEIPYRTFMVIVNDIASKKLQLIYLENKEPKYIDIPYTNITSLTYKSEIVMENDKPKEGTEEEYNLLFNSVILNNVKLNQLAKPNEFNYLLSISKKYNKRENSHYEFYIDLKEGIVVGIDKVYKISFTLEKKPEEFILRFNELNGIKSSPRVE